MERISIGDNDVKGLELGNATSVLHKVATPCFDGDVGLRLSADTVAARTALISTFAVIQLKY